ncbi:MULTISPECIES: glycosyltransferase [unclassified Ectothiorhodospira]|uniref:glycosyltransferase n=1 Tax=unclassified Ectothiorhodospira TaxID=2684909 RepID=UPI001EE7BF31|nr:MULTISPECIES: glycosyltransferase [unclassified Ectothiorhodospira]MCG5517203.1 glycosyltransferase [Ectothiorhodospira sp. 9100]MCG5519766.1 glycosyltransferase [Ectothiorhodospira sp. 9905]
MTQPSDIRVSVIIPAYNARSYIGDAIHSVEAQGIDHLELIVVDDGSTDGTGDYIKHHHPSVELIRKSNGGAATARNAGLARATGEYIAFLDADDLWLPGKLEAQLSHLAANPQVQLVCSGFERWEPDSQGEFPSLQPLLEQAQTIPQDALDTEFSGWIYHKLLLDCRVWTSTVVFRRSLMNDIGRFDESLRLGQDYDYWLRASRHTPIHTLRRPMAVYRQHAHSATARGASVSYGARVITNAVKRWGYESPDGQKVPARDVRARVAGIHFTLGYLHYADQHYRLAVRDFASSISQHPLQPKAWAYLGLAAIKAPIEATKDD